MKKKKENFAVRQFMENQVRIYGSRPSKVLVGETKRAFARVSANRIAGNLSALCCYYQSLKYQDGVVS